MSNPAPYFLKGAWNAVCDLCGRQFKSFQLMKNWKGQMVCRQDWEPRQPQDFVRGVKDVQMPPWVRPDGEIYVMGSLLITEISSEPYGTLDYILTEAGDPLETES